MARDPGNDADGASIACPAQVGKRIRPRPAFGKRFTVFVDTEEEFDWTADFSRSARDTTAIGALPEATRRFNDLGVKPVYLCDYPVVANDGSRDIVRDLFEQGRCEVGAHLHPWVNPPHVESVSGRNSFTGNLPNELQRQKLRELTAAVIERIGTRPTVFRAGRYGLGPETMAHLAEAGYRLDTSVRSLFDYSADMGPNYLDCPCWPWKTPEGVFELPLTAAWTGNLRRFPSLHEASSLRGPLARTAMLARVPLTPEGTTGSQAVEAVKVLHGDGLDVFSLSFHSPTLAIGHTPYVSSAQDLLAFWNWWDAILNVFAQLGIEYASTPELIEEFDGR